MPNRILRERKNKRNRPCPKFTPEQKERGYICVDGKISIDKNKRKEYQLKKSGGTRKYAGPRNIKPRPKM